MAVMPEGRDTEEPDAGRGKEQAAEALHEDMVARLLEYRRRLSEEIGDEAASSGEGLDAAPSAQDELVPSDAGETSEEGSELPPPEPRAAQRVSDDESSETPDARQLKERIDRLDETLARISAMLPLLRGETKRDPEP